MASSCIVLSVPRLWTQTIETHRHEVRDAILDTTAALVSAHGLRAVTMSQIAEQVGIGRATLYKYFPDVEAILLAWHEGHVAGHLAELEQLCTQAGDPDDALQRVLNAYAALIHERARHTGGTDVSALLHHATRVSGPEHDLQRLLRDALADAARTGCIRSDVPPDELANYCLHALNAAARAPNVPAVQRIAALTLDSLRRPGSNSP